MRRVALVTGAARGIGRVTARVLCERGMAVAVNDVSGEGAEQAAEELRLAGYTAWAYAADVTSAAEVTRMVERVDTEAGPLWLLVNNAGVYHSAPAAELTEQQWDEEFAVDAKGVFLCSQAAIRAMMPRREGRIVVMSSIAGVIARTGQIGYCAAKAASIHFARCLAVEMAPHGITVNCICPGMTDSEMLRRSAGARGVDLAEYEAMIPAGKLARGEDHAAAIAWLASEEAAHVTGQVISVDGGQSIYHPLTRGG
jgi:NAD(P)-dependent dehydrogenase (short-subunit alcohol dehydrogenase family)